MDNLIINNQSLSILISLRDRLPQSLLLTGSSGVGLYTIANSLAKNKNNTIFTVLPTDKDDNIDIEKGSIRVSSIRDLYRQTRTEQSNPQIIIIDFADKMSLTSQNAFLKLLEEPNPSIHFILLSHHPSMLLATILSRVWRINIKPISKKQSLNLLSSLKIFDQSTINKIMFMAEGLPAEIKRLNNDKKYFDYKVSLMIDARNFITANTYDKLLIINKYHSERQTCLNFIESVNKVARSLLKNNPDPIILDILRKMILAYDKISKNQNIRLQLSRAVI